jgi:hypothetical protein
MSIPDLEGGEDGVAALPAAHLPSTEAEQRNGPAAGELGGGHRHLCHAAA